MSAWSYEIKIDRAAMTGPGWEHGVPTAMVESQIAAAKRKAEHLGIRPESIIVEEEETDSPYRCWVLTGEFRPEE